MAKFKRFFDVKIPKKLKPEQRIALARDVIDFIKGRTASGEDKNGNKFKEYTEEYASKKGTSRGNVDLILSGEMLEALKLISHKKGELRIGYESGDPNLGKAEGNVLGTYGQPKPIPGKKRDYMGISKKDVDAIASIMDADEEDLDKEAQEIADTIASGIEFEQ